MLKLTAIEILRQVKEELTEPDEIEAICMAIAVLRTQIEDREDLPYDAFGDYSHNPQPNTYAGRTNVSGFVADEWYRENFGGRK